MDPKRFFAAALALTLLLLAAAAGFVVWTDPLLTVGKLEEGETALFMNERYEMAGLIRNQDYSALVMGTSLVANYRASWFTEGLGQETLKITFPDGWIAEFDTALDLALRTHPEVDTVFFCLDPNILVRPDSERRVELPAYLYNDDPLDDVELYLSADALALAVKTLRERQWGWATGLDDAYVWDGTCVFSKETVLEGYTRPEPSGTALPEDAYLAAAEENLDVICGWIERHPGIRFHIWFPPYSVLYWDKMTREGTADAILNAVEHAAGRLVGYENASVYIFLALYDTITDLDNYTDHVHCSGTVNRWVAWTMMGDYWRLSEDRYRISVDELRRFVHSYDYDAIFN